MANHKDRVLKERRERKQRPATERRQGGDRRNGAYRAFAQQLPDGFVSLAGSPRDRVLRLLRQYCIGCDESLQADLAQALLPTLQTMLTLDGGVISESHRSECEALVERCVKQNELATGRWRTSCTESSD